MRVLNIIDDYNRECVAIQVGLSMGAQRVTRVLDWAVELYGRPQQIRTDNGPEFTAHHYQEWCKRRGIQTKYIQPGKPNQNGYIERFNRTFREDVLDAYLFSNLHQLQVIADKWRTEYNEGHPHQSLQGKSPQQFKCSRSKIIDDYQRVKAIINDSIESALTPCPSPIGWSLHDHLNDII